MQSQLTFPPLPIVPQEFSKKKMSDSAWKRFRRVARQYIKDGGLDEILAQELNKFSYNITPRQARRLVDNYRRRRDVGHYRLHRHPDSRTHGPAWYTSKKSAQAIESE